VLIVDAGSGDTLYSHGADELFVPASNMKIVSGAIGLATRGKEFRWRTPFVARGRIEAGTLHGDLLVVGRGDPSVSDHVSGDAMLPLRAATESLLARGVRHVAGRVLPSGNAFPDANAGFGWSWEDLDNAYGAPIDELLFNEGFSEIHVAAAETAGQPPTFRTSPARTFPVVRMEALTVARGAGEDTVARLDAVKDTATGQVVVSGTIPLGDSATLEVTHRDPAAAYVAALREAMRERGISVGDSAFADSLPVDTLFALESPPLATILGFFLKPSQNQIGEMLFKSVALHRADTGSARVARRITAERLRQWGARDDGFLVWDGSGLSRRDLLSPSTIIRVLDAMRKHTDFRVFYDAMPIAGVDGTLRGRMRSTQGEANVRGKTGTLGNVRSLSGYVTTRSGRIILFSVLCNNYLVPTSRISAVQDTIAVSLARLGERRGTGR
jgi:D-alanyl-D-alanine carboxypeptidase/D-alanyl-D-alanine-endopeptidase (penicillin-binding protein 4)